VTRTFAALLLAALCTAGEASAQRLGIDGRRFTIDGTPRFLMFISYFGAMGAKDLIADLDFVKAAGFDGVRIWPNSPDGPQLMRTDGTLDPDNLSKLLGILEAANARRIIVDVTFTAEHIAGMDASLYGRAIAAAIDPMRPYRNLLIDIENERNIYGPFKRPLAAADVVAIKDAIKAIDPARIVTASNSQDLPAADAGRFTGGTGLDVAAYHDPRRSGFHEAAQIESLVQALAVSGRPIYFQEPIRFTRDIADRAEYFFTAAVNARRAGAAAWCFHTELGFNVRTQLFRERLQSRSEPDWAFVTSLAPRVFLRTSDATHFVSAAGGGGSSVVADSRVPAAWETFAVRAVDGGPIVSGDRVTIWTADNRHLLQASEGGGTSLNATATAAGPWETFIVEKNDARPLSDGDVIAIRTATTTPWYVGAELGGGGPVNVNRRSRGEWETFSVVSAGAAALEASSRAAPRADRGSRRAARERSTPRLRRPTARAPLPRA